jgi:hypothetical protein
MSAIKDHIMKQLGRIPRMADNTDLLLANAHITGVELHPDGVRPLKVEPIEKKLMPTEDALTIALAVLDATADKCQMFSDEWEHVSAAATTLQAIKDRGNFRAPRPRETLCSFIDNAIEPRP